MPIQTWGAVFANAALPQRVVLFALFAATPLVILAAIRAYQLKRSEGPWATVVSELRLGGPLLGLFVGAMDSFHMGRTMLRVPFNPTAKQIAPGILEVATLVGLGAWVVLAGVRIRHYSGAAPNTIFSSVGRRSTSRCSITSTRAIVDEGVDLKSEN